MVDSGLQNRFWLCNWRAVFITSLLCVTNCGALSTITSALLDQSFGCQGKPFTLTCSTNAETPSWFVNGEGYYFFDRQPEVILRGQISTAYLLGRDDNSFLSITIVNLTTATTQVECGHISNVETQFTIRHAEIPQVPKNTTVTTLLRTETKAILMISWTITTPYNYDLEHYQVTIDGNTRARVKETSTLVEVSMNTDDEYMVPVSVTTVDKCGQQSEAGMALHMVPAINDVVPTVTNTVATADQVVEPGQSTGNVGNAVDQQLEGTESRTTGVRQAESASCSSYVIAIIVLGVVFIITFLLVTVFYALVISYLRQRSHEGKLVISNNGVARTDNLEKNSPILTHT